jgi:chorismate mutase
MINNKIIQVRKKLDLLDNKFLDLIKKRTKLVNLIVKNKKYKKEIVDKKRIKKIINIIRKKSIKKNIDPIITKTIWINMIRAYIKYEYRVFKKK